MEDAARTTAYTYHGANEYASIGSRAVSYDNKGNFEKDVNGSWTTTYTYDHDNRLKKIQIDIGSFLADAARFENDALGRMVNSFRR